ncbi:MAG: hypothetical protein ACE5KA_04625 [Nitrososphaerales archaeon]
MNESEQTIILRHSGLSLGEIEILFNMLREPFTVNEESEEIADESYVSVVNLSFPLSYGKNFFRTFGMDKWEQIKEVLKNMKWRRGKKGVKLVLKFVSNPTVSFVVSTENDKMFGKALDTIEYLMDVILFQIDRKRLPNNIIEVHYEFNEIDYKWYPSKAISDREYIFVGDEWIMQ